jgi:integrase
LILLLNGLLGLVEVTASSGSGRRKRKKVIPTLEAFAEEFLVKYARTNNKASEAHTKGTMLRAHLVPAFGSKRLDAIGPREIEGYKATKVKSGYEAKSINNQLGVLRRLLRIAVEWRLIDAAPAVKPLKASKPPIRFLDFDEAKLLVDAVEDSWRTMVLTALNTGLRHGELLALRWEHVDLRLGQLVVCENDWRGVIGTPKGNRTRVIPLNDTVLAGLKHHRHGRGPLVFCRGNGERFTYHQLRGHCSGLAKRRG